MRLHPLCWDVCEAMHQAQPHYRLRKEFTWVSLLLQQHYIESCHVVPLTVYIIFTLFSFNTEFPSKTYGNYIILQYIETCSDSNSNFDSWNKKENWCSSLGINKGLCYVNNIPPYIWWKSCGPEPSSDLSLSSQLIWFHPYILPQIWSDISPTKDMP